MLAGACLALYGLPATAQTAPDAVGTAASADANAPVVPSAPSDPAAAAASSATDRNQIVVTGSRIARSQFAEPNPIVSYDAAALRDSGNTNVTNFLVRVPALTGSRDSTQTSGGNAVYSNPFGAAGLNELNLRNLGVNRTLVLVNGRRHVPGEPGSAAVDINSIPTDLIQKVDVLTGTASAVYGADAVSGVVNFIMKRDFEGITARTQNGISQRGDGANHFASIVAGKNFADGRGNVTLAYEYSADDRIENDDRRYLTQARRRYLIPNDADVGDDPKVPDNVLVGDLRYSNESFIGAVFVDGEANPSFDGLGRPYDNGQPAAYYRTGGVSSPVAGFYSGDLFPRIRRQSANLMAHYDFSDAFKLSVEGKFAQTHARTFDYILGTYYYAIPVDNPFVPATIRQAAAAAGADTLYVNRDVPDYGRHGEDDRRRTYRGVVDVAGRISDHASYDAYYTYGRTDVRITKLNDRLADQYTQALDAVVDPASGAIVCRSRAPGCVPVSLFGDQPISRQALAFFQVDDVSHAAITQQVANASVSGDFGQFFSLPGGPIQFSFGGEYRRETSRFSPSANLTNARFFQYDEPSLVVGARGKFDVKEAFGELNAPILKDARFASTLSVGAAYRFSHYSTVGNTTTWQVNGVYAPVRDITFRGSYGKAVRAPNVGELFQPTTGTSNFFVDPCTPMQINNGTQYRAANCATLLAAVGATISDGLQTGSNVLGTATGNPNLKAESARTWTAGTVLRPRWLPNLVVSLDWYDIDLKDAINTVTPGDLANLCVDQQTIANPFCAAITRAQGTGIINGFVVSPQNVARFRTAGADLNLDYLLRTAKLGVFDIRLVGGYLNRLQFIGIPGAPVTDNLNQFGAPRWNANFSPTWTLGRVTVNYNLRWFDRTRTQPKNVTAGNPDYAARAQLYYKALWQHDVQLQYELPNGFQGYAGVTNLTDQKPDPGNSINAPISALGRYFYVGIRIATGSHR